MAALSVLVLACGPVAVVRAAPGPTATPRLPTSTPLRTAAPAPASATAAAATATPRPAMAPATPPTVPATAAPTAATVAPSAAATAIPSPTAAAAIARGTPSAVGMPGPAATATSLTVSATPRPSAIPTPLVRGDRERLDKLDPSQASATPTAAAAGDAAASDASATPEGGDAEADRADDWHAFVPTDTADHLATMDRAARDSGCGVPWQLLAAIARVESDFGRNMATSSAGAIGYGQFLPSSWQAFGNDGNAYDYRDALPAIATYLCESGLARDPRSALFAYNHADWYVDLVLSLAVRYDRLAPGAPTPDILDTSPLADLGTPLHYAAGRDMKLQARARTGAGDVTWLGVPWRGRPAGAPIHPTAMQTSSLAMLRAAFGLSGEPAPPAADTDPGLIGLADRGWADGLLPLDLFEVPGRQRGWSIYDVRRHLAQGQPVVALLGGRALPGHPPQDAPLDQPVVVIGLTPSGLVYNDPSFSSSLGYGLELSIADFETAWQAASTPHQALAFTRRPRLPAREAHVKEADPGEVFARQTATPVPTPLPVVVAPTRPPAPAAEPTLGPMPTAEPPVAAPTAVPLAATATASAGAPDVSPLVVLAAFGLVGAAVLRRRLR
jgi:hypothetical protein